MIVCSCNIISDHDIRGVVVSANEELCSAAQVYNCLGCSVRCGLCSHSVRRILEEQLPCDLQYSNTAETMPQS
ncbi:BFD-like [2Fe-2S] binding domain-containing protein [Bradyrhizobium sp. cf659]|nr:BFD-like [2Fe-2S] binding domain-containing protein [Bradyrhizobium sp. cf659]